MQLTLAMLLLLFLAFSGYHLSFRPLKLPLFAHRFYLTGTEFLFLGLLLGPAFFNLMDTDTQKGLTPVAHLLLGWIGLLLGFQIESRKLRRAPMPMVLAALIEGLVTFMLVFALTQTALSLWGAFSPACRLSITLTLSAAAACTAQTGLALLSRQAGQEHRDLTMLLRFISSLDGLGALLLFGLIFFFQPVCLADMDWPSALWRSIGASLGTALGTLLLYMLFLAYRRSEKEIALGVIGLTLLGSGLAADLHFSPFLTNVLVGFGLVNLSRDKERIYHLLLGTEKPVYLLVLLFLGLNWQMQFPWLPVLALGYCLWRLLAKLAAGSLLTTCIPAMRKHPRKIGYGLLDQGGLPLAMLLDFQGQFPPLISTPVVSLILWAVILNEILGPYFLNRLLRKDLQ